MSVQMLQELHVSTKQMKTDRCKVTKTNPETSVRWQMVWVVFTCSPAGIYNASFVWHAPVKCLQKEGWKWLNDTVADVCIVMELKLCKLHMLWCWIQSLYIRFVSAYPALSDTQNQKAYFVWTLLNVFCQPERPWKTRQQEMKWWKKCSGFIE